MSNTKQLKALRRVDKNRRMSQSDANDFVYKFPHRQLTKATEETKFTCNTEEPVAPETKASFDSL